VALFAVWLAGNRWLPWNDLGSTIHSREAGQPSLLGRFDLGTVALTLRSLFLVEPAVAFRWPYGWLATAVQVLLGAWVLFLAGLRTAPAPARAQEKKRGGKRRSLTALKGLGGLMAFAGLWCLSGILPLVTVTSHFVYYAYYPALGLSVLLAALTWAFLTRGGAARRAAWAGLALLATVFTAGAGLVYHAATCDAQNIRRASAHLHNFRADLRRMHPSFPESSRVYFWNIPYWIGFQLADGPAMRVWYADPTLTGLFLSAYAPAPRRASFFFGHDDAMHLVEIVRGHPDPYLADPPPIYTLAHTDLGSTLAKVGEIDGALVEWRKVLEVNPNFPDAAANLGMTLLRKGSLVEAVPALERAVQLEPEAADVRLELGQAYYRVGARAEALATLETYLRLAPAAPNRAQVEELISSLRAELGGG
jgi:tetratricopeptide (TPR) repeat protein